jgi:hypothetical protein
MWYGYYEITKLLWRLEYLLAFVKQLSLQDSAKQIHCKENNVELEQLNW